MRPNSHRLGSARIAPAHQLINKIADLIRDRRNEAGHPQDPPAVRTHEEMYALLMVFPDYCVKLYELKRPGRRVPPRVDRIALVTTVLGLTPHFRTIIATDASPRQIAQCTTPTPRSPTSSPPPSGHLWRRPPAAVELADQGFTGVHPLGLSFVLKKQ